MAIRLFVWSAVAALRRHGELPRVGYTVRVCNCPSGEKENVFELDCREKEILHDNEAFARTLQQEDITEFGAVGLTLLYVAEYTDLRVVEATQRGDRAEGKSALRAAKKGLSPLR
jgi:hypothetical protein